MLDVILNDEKFNKLMRAHIDECLDYLLQNKFEFSITANINNVKCDANLHRELKSKHKHMITFAFGGFTLDSARLEKDELVFEAGFGDDTFAHTIAIKFNSILQITVQDTPILLNLTAYDS